MSPGKKTALLCVYFLSSSSLLVLNKVAITAIPNASLLLMVQTSSTVILLVLPSFLCGARIDLKPSKRVVYAYVSVAFVFLATIYSNFQVIHTIGVNPFVILRCSTPLMVSILDWAFLGRKLPNCNSLLALLGIITGGFFYANSKLAEPKVTDVSAATKWCLIWLFSFLLDMVYIKHVVQKFPCSNSERTVYQNSFAVPIIMVLLLTDFDNLHIGDVGTISTGTFLAVISTCLAGTALSYTGMSLRSELSATAFTILGVVCKMASIFMNEVFIEPENNLFRLSCIVAVVISSAMYRQAPLR